MRYPPDVILREAANAAQYVVLFRPSQAKNWCRRQFYLIKWVVTIKDTLDAISIPTIAIPPNITFLNTIDLIEK